MTGCFWVLEGMDGSGKSTQAQLLVENLRKSGRKTLHLREPGSTELGEALRALLLNAERGDWDPRSEALLFFAARNELLRNQIAPALDAEHDIVCERFTPSTLAYQAQTEALSHWVLDLDLLVVPADLQPCGVWILDLEPAISFARIDGAEGPDGFEQRGIGFQSRVREGYLAYARAHPENTVILSVENRTIPELAATIFADVEARRR